MRIPKGMGIVWEAYHKGVALLGVPAITLENTFENTSVRLTVFDVLGKTLLEKVADVTNNAKQCLRLKEIH